MGLGLNNKVAFIARSSNLISADVRAELVLQARSLFEASIALKQLIKDTQIDTIVRMAEVIFHSISQGGKIMLCGNGGSAADAQHLAAEFLVRLRPHINREGIPALALVLDSSSLTACANDLGFESYYARITRTLGLPGDVLIGISTTGKSVNIVRAMWAAHEKGMITIGLLGGDGGLTIDECDLSLIVPSTITGRIQESHITIGHALIEIVEDLLLARGHLHKEGRTE